MMKTNVFARSRALKLKSTRKQAKLSQVDYNLDRKQTTSRFAIIGKDCTRRKRRGDAVLLLAHYCLASTIFAIGAFFFTDSMPLTHASFDE